jgi:translation initiation factor IF-2
LLVAEFSKDKKIKKEAIENLERMHRKDDKRETIAIEGYEIEEKPKKKIEKETIKAEIPDDLKPKFNVVGSIDLDEHKKLKKETEAKQEEVEAEVEIEVEIEVEVKEVKPEETAQKEEEVETVIPKPVEPEEIAVPHDEAPVVTEAPSFKAEETPEETADEGQKDDSIQEEKTETEEDTTPQEKGTDEVFRIRKELKEPNIVVKGSIDLESINDRTRPPRKSRAQRKKERLEREKEQNAKKAKEEAVKSLKKESIEEKEKKKGAVINTAEEDSKKKKRKRIDKGKVNIEKAGAHGESIRRDKKVLRKPIKAEVSEEDVQKQIKETLARLTEKRGGKGGARYRREKREAVSQRQREEIKQQERESKILQLTEFVTANDLANMMDVPVTSVIATCMNLGVMVAINQRLDAETINIVADEFGYKTKFVSADVIEAIAEEEDNPEDLLPRPPIVTVMGHVDHGKTSLLDSIRNTNVIEGEAGGITQHIGAYNVKLPDGRKITFLDTPGHEAFTAMRARGAKVTDVAIIIVAADDNVMPQTVEAINHAGAAGVPIVFAINKIDKPGANPEKIKERLAEMNYLVEDWGGKYQSQDISAKKGIGINELLEKVLLEADLLELKANPDRKATGSIVESSLDKGRGYVATVLVENGTLRQGDVLLAGSYYGRVKAMFNERNQKINEAGPAEPALVLGLNGAPQAGDTFNVMESDQDARNVAARREQLQREQSLRTQKMLTLDDIGRRIAIGNFQQLNIIVKGDVDGSVEALSDSLIRLSTEEIQVNVIHKAVGQISESDVTLAAASDGVIIGFQVRPSLGARREAEKQGIDIRLYSIIYDAIEEVKAAMEGMLSPDIKEEITANVEVLDVFKITKVGTVAGSMVRDGKIKRTNKIRLIRDGIVIFTGELDSLKRFKEDVREVASGYECGISIKNFNDIKVGDIIESYEQIEVKKTL